MLVLKDHGHNVSAVVLETGQQSVSIEIGKDTSDFYGLVIVYEQMFDEDLFEQSPLSDDDEFPLSSITYSSHPEFYSLQPCSSLAYSGGSDAKEMALLVRDSLLCGEDISGMPIDISDEIKFGIMDNWCVSGIILPLERDSIENAGIVLH